MQGELSNTMKFGDAICRKKKTVDSAPLFAYTLIIKTNTLIIKQLSGENMKKQYDTIGELLRKTVKGIHHVEDKAIMHHYNGVLTTAEVIIIDAIGPDGCDTMSSLSKNLGITMGTLSVAINNLKNKGFCTRVRSMKDRRLVLIKLTEDGMEAFSYYRNFYKKMIQGIAEDYNQQEVSMMLDVLKRLNDYFSHTVIDNIARDNK